MKKRFFQILLIASLFMLNEIEANSCTINICDNRDGICLICSGLGMVPFYHSDGYSSSVIYVPCSNCNGTGKTGGSDKREAKPEKKNLHVLNAVVGKWQYVHSDFTTHRFTLQFFRDGSSLNLIEFLNPFWHTWSPNVTYPKEYRWGYVKTGEKSGLLEEYQGNELVNRFSVFWTSPNNFTARLEYTTEYVVNKSNIYYFQRG